GGTGTAPPDGATDRAGSAPRDFAGDGRHHRPERIAASAPVHRGRWRHRHRADQARWHSQGRSGGGDLARVGCSGALRGSRREGRRSAPVRSEGIRGFAVRLRFLQVCQNPILVQCRPSGTWSVSSIGPRLTPGANFAASRLGPIVFEGTDCVERIAPFLPRDFACLIITLTKSFCARRWNWRVAALGSLPPTRTSELSSSPKTAKWWARASTPTRA